VNRTIGSPSTPRTPAIAAVVGGAAWVIDVVVIIAINNSFDPLDSILFLGGLLSLIAAGILATTLVARRRHGRTRLAAAAASIAALTAMIAVISLAGAAIAHALIPTSNRGHNEGAVLAAGIVTLITGIVLLGNSRTRRRTHIHPT
jgi:uncharacterized membrane protein HdeD (DUF308 family)